MRRNSLTSGCHVMDLRFTELRSTELRSARLPFAERPRGRRVREPQGIADVLRSPRWLASLLATFTLTAALIAALCFTGERRSPGPIPPPPAELDAALESR